MANTTINSIVETYGCMSNFQDMKAFFANASNASAVQDAIAKYGVPKENTKSYHTGFSIFGKWHDPCDWQNISKFYYFAKLSAQFPTPTILRLDCSKAFASLSALNALVPTIGSLSMDENQKGAFKEAVNDKIAEYTTFIAANMCKEKTSTDSNSSFGTTSKTKLVIYLVGGLVAVGGIIFAVSKLRNKQ